MSGQTQTQVMARDMAPYVRASASGESQIELLVQGAHCAACIKRIEGAMLALQGVTAARLNLSTGKLSVSWRGGLDPAELPERLTELGFTAAPFGLEAAAADEDATQRFLMINLAVAGAASLTLMHMAVWGWAGAESGDMGDATRTALQWLSALIAIPATLFAGRPFFYEAIAALKARRASMDIPISLAVILSLYVSLQETVLGGLHVYYDAGVMLLALLLIGRTLDHRLRRKARASARALMALQAPQAALFDRKTGTSLIRRAEDIVPGDVLLIRPGDRLPVDARILEGEGHADRAIVTGESAPVSVRAGDGLHAGTLSLDARLVVEVTARSSDSLVARLTRLVEAGEQSRTKYVQLADRAAALYVPVVHGLALLTAVMWLWPMGAGPREAILAATAVLIVTCPCALGLAVPAVMVVATGRLFRAGILVKSGDALERLARVTHAVFDKTGTLTLGRPRLSNFDAIPTRDLHAAAQLARASRHPLAQAVAWAAGPGRHADEIVETPGEGVCGKIDGEPAWLGRARFAGAPEAASGETELWFRCGARAPVRFTFADALRADAVETVVAFKARGLHVSLLSGDAEAPARAMAAEAGIDTVEAALTPQGKLDRLHALERAGAKTLMIGDGLNDAPALAHAGVSIAPGSAADAAQAASDLVLLSDTLRPAVTALDVARAARRRVIENFWFAALYNAFAIPLAAGGWVTPLIAAALMSASSLVVMLNALRLSRG